MSRRWAGVWNCIRCPHSGDQIRTDDQNQQMRRTEETELAEARAQLVVWKRLREMIGSHDGSKFRRYAQAISLDILTRHANRHLVKLSDRYRISRDVQDALNLQIEDLHQASVRRPMTSLSGGESFLASLALALGLSDLAGRTVRIDSLFIDEGFGSLDPEAPANPRRLADASKPPNGKRMDHAGVERATGPSRRATNPAERRGADCGNRSPLAKRAPHPFRPAGRRTVRASGPCHLLFRRHPPKASPGRTGCKAQSIASHPNRIGFAIFAPVRGHQTRTPKWAMKLKRPVASPSWVGRVTPCAPLLASNHRSFPQPSPSKLLLNT